MHNVKRIQFWGFFSIFLTGLALTSPVQSAEGKPDNDLKGAAFPQRYLIRLSSYRIDEADTEVAVQGTSGLGTTVNFSRDLGVENEVTVPRLDFNYRFNKRHSLDIGYFKYSRDGRQSLRIDIEIGDETFSIGDEVITKTDYELLKVGYAYSFYHSSRVELAFTVGLNITNYDFDFALASGGKRETSGASAPLPMTGLRMGFKMTDNWVLLYRAESFFVKIDDEIKGALLNNELSVEYQFNNGLALGFGLTRVGADLDYSSDEGKGRITDTHQGYLFYGSYYF